MEIEIVSDSSVAFGSQRELLPRTRVKIVAQSVKTEFIDIAGQAKHQCRPASPAAGQFLPFAEIIRMSVVALR